MSHNSYYFHSGWLLSRNLGILDVQTVKRGIYGRKSANVQLTCTLKYVPDVILDRKSPLLWKDINACGQKHKHTHIEIHINTHTHRSIIIKAVGIKYKDASNLQTHSLKWAILFQLKSKDNIFLSNSVKFVLIITKLQTSSNILIFPFCFPFRNGTIHIMHTV